MAVRIPLKHSASRKPVMLYDMDVELLRVEYNKIGYNAAVREIVHKHCEKLRKKHQTALEELPNVRAISNPRSGG